MEDQWLESLGRRLGLAYKHLSRLLLHRLRAYDLTPEQWSVLSCIAAKGPLIQKEIGQLTGKDKPTITRILGALEEKGFITKASGSSDHRSYQVYATEKGKTTARETAPVERKVIEQVTEGITEEDYRLLLDLIQQIGNNADRLTRNEQE